MTKKRTFAVLVVVLMVLVASCGTLFVKGGNDYRAGMTAYTAKEYVKALGYMAKALMANPVFAEALEIYPVIFREGSDYYSALVVDNEAGGDLQSADRVLGAYSNLQALHDIARDGSFGSFVIKDFSEEIRQAAQKAGQLWFSYAESLASENDRASMRLAVSAFETAKERNSQIPGIDLKISAAIEQATVSLMVLGIGPDEAFHAMALHDIENTFASDRFVRVVEAPGFRGVSPMVGPIDLAIEHGRAQCIDYLIEISVYNRTEQISKEEPVRLPSETPLFSGIKRTVGYTIKNTVSYRLFDLQTMKVVAGNTFSTEDGPYLYDFRYVKSEGVRELDLGGTGEKNLRFVSASIDEITLRKAIDLLRNDYSDIAVPYEVSDPTDQTQWIKYYEARYDSFEDFLQMESGRELFYAIEVVFHPETDSYFTLGTALDEAILESRVNSAIMNALSYAARKLIEDEKDNAGSSYYFVAQEVGERIKDLL